MFCPRCGTPNKERAKFCCSCGIQMIQFVQETEQQMNRSTDSKEPRIIMPKNKYYRYQQNEKMNKYIQISAKALYILVFLVYFIHLADVSIQKNIEGAELFITNIVMPLGAFKIMLLLFCVVQEGLVLFAHLKLNYTCALVLLGTMLLHGIIIGIDIVWIVWVACAGFFAYWIYRFDKKYRFYCENEEA